MSLKHSKFNRCHDQHTRVIQSFTLVCKLICFIAPILEEKTIKKKKKGVDQAAGLTHSCGLSTGVGGTLSSQFLPPSLSNSNNCGCPAAVYSFISLFGHASSAFLTLPNETTGAHAHAARKPSADTPVTIYTSKYVYTHSHTLMAKCKDF